MKDVAERAKVSLSTVSRVLRGERLQSFSSETRERIEKCAKELGWRPNLLVQGIQTGRTYTIGVVIPPFDTYWTQVLYGIHDQLLENDCVPLVLWPGESREQKEARTTNSENSDDGQATTSPRNELLRLHCLADRRVDGIITWPLHEQDALSFLAQLGSQGLPIVTIDSELPTNARSLSIEIDEADAMRLILDHLITLGHQRIVYLGSTETQAWSLRRRESFEQISGSRNSGVVLVDERSDDPAAVLGEELRKKTNVTAVVAATDHLALQAVRSVAALGKCVPRDVSVVGFGDLEFEGVADLPLTTINQNPRMTGDRAAKEVLRRDAFTHRRRVKIQPELVVRTTTDVPPKSKP